MPTSVLLAIGLPCSHPKLMPPPLNRRWAHGVKLGECAGVALEAMMGCCEHEAKLHLSATNSLVSRRGHDEFSEYDAVYNGGAPAC